MHIQSDKLRETYYAIKAANVLQRIKEVTKAHHDPGKEVRPPQEDNIAGVPTSLPNEEITDVNTPLESSTPSEDPEFYGGEIIAGTGSGPSMESRRKYHK